MVMEIIFVEDHVFFAMRCFPQNGMTLTLTHFLTVDSDSVSTTHYTQPQPLRLYIASGFSILPTLQGQSAS